MYRIASEDCRCVASNDHDVQAGARSIIEKQHATKKEKTMLDLSWARAFAEEWIAAWNSHDLDRILTHYADDFEMASPLIIERMKEPSGVLKGKEKVRAYWQKGLSATPPIEFALIDVFVGVDSITIYYRSVARKIAAEVLVFNDRREVVKGIAHYGQSA